MQTITLSRFDKSARAFTYIDGYKACVSSADENCSGIQAHMDGLIRQLHAHPDEPTGWSFGTWRRGQNVASNLVSANGIMLEYALRRDDTEIVARLHERAMRLGWTFFMIDTETKNGNTITVVFPTTAEITTTQYARLASILAEELNEYGMESGSLSATHIVQVHRSSTPVVFAGTPLDADREIKRTAKLYQGLNARKYEGNRPARKSSAQSSAREMIEDDLFAWPLTEGEARARDADQLLASLGVTLG